MSSTRAHAAADGERHEAALGRALDDVEDGVAVLVAGGDVEEAQLVGAGGVVGRGGLDGIAGVAQVDEVDALDDAAVLDVEAGDDADFQHGALLRRSPAGVQQKMRRLAWASLRCERRGSARPSAGPCP